MPSRTCHIFPNFVIDLRLFQHLKVNIGKDKTFSTVPHDFDRAHKWQSHLRQTEIHIRRPACIRKHDGAAVLKAPSRDQTVEKQRLVIWVQFRSKSTRLIQSPASGHDHNVNSVSSQYPECFGEGEVPAGEQTDPSYWSIDCDMLVLPARLVCSLGMPEVLLLVGAEDTSIVRDEVCCVEELELSLLVFEYVATGYFDSRCDGMPFDESPWDDAHFEL
jgi:hypothetical protein